MQGTFPGASGPISQLLHDNGFIRIISVREIGGDFPIHKNTAFIFIMFPAYTLTVGP